MSARELASNDFHKATLTKKEIEKNENPQRKIMTSVFAKALYIKVISEGIKYAETQPQTPTLQPTMNSIDQKFDFSWGWQAGARLSFYNKFCVESIYSYLKALSPHIYKFDSNQGIIATLVIPVFASNGNYLVKEVSGFTNIDFNNLDINLKTPIIVTKYFEASPLFGFKGTIINQNTQVNYQDFQIDFPNQNTPQEVSAKSKMKWLGTTIGIEGDYEIGCGFGFNFTGAFSILAGNSHLKTYYKNLLLLPSESYILMEENSFQIVSSQKIDFSLSKKIVSQKKYIKFEIGLDMQNWNRLVQANYFSTVVYPQQGSDLCFLGGFAGMDFSF